MCISFRIRHYSTGYYPQVNHGDGWKTISKNDNNVSVFTVKGGVISHDGFKCVKDAKHVCWAYKNAHDNMRLVITDDQNCAGDDVEFAHVDDYYY